MTGRLVNAVALSASITPQIQEAAWKKKGIITLDRYIHQKNINVMCKASFLLFGCMDWKLLKGFFLTYAALSHKWHVVTLFRQMVLVHTSNVRYTHSIGYEYPQTDEKER